MLGAQQATPDPVSEFTGPVLLALGFSALGLLASLLAVGVTVATFALSGGRVRVQMNLAEVVPYAGIYKISVHNEGLRRLSSSTQADPDLGMELVAVVIDNPGRLPITITLIELALTGAKEAKYSVTPRLFHVPMVDPSSTATTFFRLEPYARVTAYLDLWSAVESERAQGNDGDLLVRAQVRVAGKRRRSKSRRSLRWAIPSNHVTSRASPEEITVSDIVLRELMRHGWSNKTYDDGSQRHTLRTPLDHVLARNVGRRVTAQTTQDELSQVLTDEAEIFAHDSVSGLGIVAIQSWEHLEAYRARMTWEA